MELLKSIEIMQKECFFLYEMYSFHLGIVQIILKEGGHLIYLDRCNIRIDAFYSSCQSLGGRIEKKEIL